MDRPSLLVVEDTNEHYEQIATSLGHCYRIERAASMQEAMKLASANEYDLFLLDIVLPDGDGYQVCTYLKNRDRSKERPIIFLSSKTEVTDKVIGFSLGAEDYIVKPCAPLELKARVDSRLRKRHRAEIGSFHGLHINFLNQKITVDLPEGVRELDLTPREYKLLAFLARNIDAVLSREQILRSVWGEKMHVSDRSIDTHVAAIRKKLGPFARFIKSVHGTGYRFVPESSGRSQHTA